ncbi:hypothetical protein CAEBREN_08234 [Caenorhabditis brenneri]|uniref:Uncharacterized protein n=1 Tax=Caenorhabditis brenneri TaxID=135651 RepID=G0PD76_CAEBE|nr:hypothetical protein CAEBREN_08234 [Caenorhabditis brenneri]
MLDPRETFEKYERRSPHPTSGQQGYVTERREFVSCEYRREPIQQEQSRPPSILKNSNNTVYHQDNNREREHARLACEYRREPPQPEQGQLACELRARPTTTITTYLPENTPKKKLPIGWIVCVAVCIPILIVIIVFAAVWLQEVGFI